jgi:hypothetical protein
MTEAHMTIDSSISCLPAHDLSPMQCSKPDPQHDTLGQRYRLSCFDPIICPPPSSPKPAQIYARANTPLESTEGSQEPQTGEKDEVSALSSQVSTPFRSTNTVLGSVLKLAENVPLRYECKDTGCNSSFGKVSGLERHHESRQRLQLNHITRPRDLNPAEASYTMLGTILIIGNAERSVYKCVETSCHALTIIRCADLREHYRIVHDERWHRSVLEPPSMPS